MNVVSSELGTYNGALETFFYITGLKTMNRDPTKLFFFIQHVYGAFLPFYLQIGQLLFGPEKEK